MENTQPDHFDTPPEVNENEGLWLTDRLMDRISRLSRVGMPLMILCAILAISSGIYFLATLWWVYSNTVDNGENFYLLDNGNLAKVTRALGTAAFIFLFSKAVVYGLNAMKLLKNAWQDDQDLLDGTEQLGKMFRLLTIGIAIFSVYMLVYAVSSR